MADDADRAQTHTERDLEARIHATRAELQPGKAGGV